ncbi:MAG TPA: DUF2161 family putative PD-(D/E)XK-type phosphodiesterase [Acetobacteraceae bacterium]|jgi:hypothetical protein
MASETSLYPPVKAFLEAQGYTVKGEVRGCDVVGTRPGEPPVVVIAELKLAFSLELVLQAVDRMAIADLVFLAVPQTRRGRDQDRRAWRLCRLLGLGLLTVNKGHVEVLAEPAPYRPRPNKPKRARLLREFTRRRGDPVPGGSTRTPIMTAYRQQALDCAAALLHQPLRPRDLRPACPDAGAILLRNVHGWFQGVSRGIYTLTPAGVAAARNWLEQGNGRE